MKMYRAFNGKTSGSGHELQVHRISWTRSDEDQQPTRSCHTGSGCPWSPSLRPRQHLQKNNFFILNHFVWHCHITGLAPIQLRTIPHWLVGLSMATEMCKWLSPTGYDNIHSKIQDKPERERSMSQIIGNAFMRWRIVGPTPTQDLESANYLADS